jgi:alkaline phosphatase D
MASRPALLRPVSRRAFLRRLALGSGATLVGCATSAAPPASSTFAFGPAAADVTATSALVWLCVNGRRRVHVEYGLDRQLRDAQVTPPVDATSETDYTATIELAGLRPGQGYFYRAVANGPGTPARGAIGRFTTAPGGPALTRFAWSGDLDAGHQPFRLLDRVVETAPHAFIMLGDTIYADLPTSRPAARSLADLRAKHRENRADLHLQRLLATTPVLAMWDDHEAENNFDRTHPLIPDARRAFREYWPVRTSHAAQLYRHCAWGPGADLFLLDCRQYRSPRGAGSGRTMLGRIQKEWLKDSLRASRALFKFVVSSVPFLGEWTPDAWSGYAEEREELLQFFRAERVPGIVVLSGDAHAALPVQDRGLHEFVAGPIGAGPLCQVYPPARAQLARQPFFMCDEPNFGLVTIRPAASPPEAQVEFRDGANAIRYSATLTPGTS